MGTQGPGAGSRTAIAASIALMVAGLAGVPMYVSSTSTAALAIQIDEACGSDLGLRLGIADDEMAGRVTAAVGLTDHLLPVREIRESFVTYDAAVEGDGLTRPAILLARPDQFAMLEREVVAPATRQVVVPEWITAEGRYLPGTAIDVTARSSSEVDPDPVRLDVVDTYADIPTRPDRSSGAASAISSGCRRRAIVDRPSCWCRRHRSMEFRGTSGSPRG